MAKIEYIDGIGIPHKSFEEEFLTHKKCSEWWYCTGYLQDDKDSLFGYQFTLAKVTILGIKFHMLICSVTDFRTKKHYNIQTPLFFGKGVTTNGSLLSVNKQAAFSFTPNTYSSKGRMKLHMQSDSFSLDVELNAVKPPVWHCDDGALQMGILDDPKERTYYYSFTNLASKGKLTLLGEEFNNLTGKTWFDRQGGTYSLTDPRTNWEWLSLRFFDNTEVMLFAFPQDGYYDGTYIAADGRYRRLNDYKLQAQEVITFEGLKFSNGWDLEMDGRKYIIRPMIDGMFNLFFFELLAEIIDESGKSVGYCFVELLPGVRNKNNPLDAFRRKK
jgi:hypothetical protein